MCAAVLFQIPRINTSSFVGTLALSRVSAFIEVFHHRWRPLHSNYVKKKAQPWLAWNLANRAFLIKVDAEGNKLARKSSVFPTSKTAARIISLLGSGERTDATSYRLLKL